MSNHLPEPDRKIPYPIAHDDEGGSLYLYFGKDCGKPVSDASGHNLVQRVIFMCAGFPDDHSAFMPLASRLAKAEEEDDDDDNWVVGVACLPGFDDRPEDGKPWTNHWKDGYSLEEIVRALKEAVNTLMREVEISSRTLQVEVDFTMVLHDWGVLYGMVLVNRLVLEEDATAKPNNAHAPSFIPNRVVLFDVGLPFHADDKDFNRPKLRHALMPDRNTTPWFQAFVEFGYRFCFASLFLLQRYISRYLALAWFMCSSMILRIFSCAPTKEIDNQMMMQALQANLYRVFYQSYVYYKLGMEYASGKFEGVPTTLPVSLERIPVLFLYGKEKNINFHEDGMVESLQAERNKQGRKSRAVGVENAGHWLYLQQPDICYKEIRSFILE